MISTVQDASKNGDERWALIKDYATNYETMTDAQAQDYIKREAANEQKVIALRMKYVPIFEKVISPKKTALFCQIDHRVDLMIQLQLASMIPMVNARVDNSSCYGFEGTDASREARCFSFPELRT